MTFLTFALVVVVALALAFAPTRRLALLVAALLVLLGPILFLGLLPFAVGAFLFIQRRRSP